MSLYEILPREPKFKDLEGEVWKEIPEFPKYKVSNMGRVCGAQEDIIGTVNWAWNGLYYIVTLMNKTKIKKKFVHVLVAEAFVENPNPEEYKFVRHINGDINDNRAENLMWYSNKGIKVVNHDGSIYIVGGKGVFVRETGKVYATLRECAEDIGWSLPRVAKWKNRGTHDGYTIEDFNEGDN